MDRIEMSATKDVIESMNNLSKLVGAHVRIEKDGFSLPGMAVIATMSPAKMCVESAAKQAMRASLDDLMKNIEAFVDSENEKNKKNEEEYKIWE